MARHSFSGSAVVTRLTAPCGSTDMTLFVNSTHNWPDTAIGPFVIIIDPGPESETEEKVEILSYSGGTLTVSQRGYDGTTAVGHAAGADGQVAHVLDATQADLWDAFVAAVGTVLPSASAPGDAGVEGASGKPADALHQHARESFGTSVSDSAPGDVMSAGVDDTPARSDHVHGREPAAGPEVPIGAIIDWPTDAIPTNYLALHGQTVTNGASTYPGLASTWPALVSGSDLVMPDTRDKFILGAGGASAPMATGGNPTITLTTADIPQFLNVAVSISDPGHNHPVTVNDPGHTHSVAPNQFVITSATGGIAFVNTGPNLITYDPATNTAATGITASTTAEPTGITGTVTIGSASPTAIDIHPPFIAFHKIVRAA